MDPAVTAALISAPVAVVAAAAAFAAGRAQARGAHRGPVDAVRRQHQRDAYATFLAAAHTFEDESNWHFCLTRAQQELTAAPGQFPTIDDIQSRAHELLRSAPVAPLRRAAAVVSLEGPDHIAAAASEVTTSMSRLLAAAVRQQINGDAMHDLITAEHQLQLAIKFFTPLARAHLNDDDKG